ncbi:hypothetical protein FRB95_001870 [Tulasnella sp. JGI-2019a]|nr:hypothetical protein FRB95_001870 [Tulasnella sp. JGI-2019a]
MCNKAQADKLDSCPADESTRVPMTVTQASSHITTSQTLESHSRASSIDHLSPSKLVSLVAEVDVVERSTSHPAIKGDQHSGNLPEELWNVVISFTNPPIEFLASLSRVSKVFAALVTPIIYRDALEFVSTRDLFAFLTKSDCTSSTLLVRTLNENPDLDSFIRSYCEIPAHPKLSRPVLSAMSNIKSAFLGFHAIDFIQLCPSREIETLTIDSTLWPPRRDADGAEHEKRFIQWLADQPDVRYLKLRRGNGWLEEFPLPSKALPRLKELTCGPGVAVIILQGRSIEKYSIDYEYFGCVLLPTDENILKAKQALEASTPPTLIAALPRSMQKLSLGMRGCDTISKLTLLSEHASNISSLRIELPEPPPLEVCEGITPILTSFAFLETFLLCFSVFIYGRPYPTRSTPRLLHDLCQACPTLRTALINGVADDSWRFRWEPDDD